jgi:hypothetical protein
MSRSIKVAIFALAAAALAVMQAQTKPNINGVWKMDSARSDFGSGPVSASRLDRISYNDPNLKDTITQKLNPGAENTYDMNYSTDGKETVNKVRGNTVNSTAHWDGDVLVVDSTVHALREQKMNDRYTLSADGKTLTLLRRMTGHFDTDQKIVFDKQE